MEFTFADLSRTYQHFTFKNPANRPLTDYIDTALKDQGFTRMDAYTLLRIVAGIDRLVALGERLVDLLAPVLDPPRRRPRSRRRRRDAPDPA